MTSRAARWRALLPAFVVLLVLLLVVAAQAGPVSLSIFDLWARITGGALTPEQQVAMATRIPRGFVALLAGGSLGAAGAVLQALTRNPLASPDITGITQGALAAVVLWLAFGPDLAGDVGYWLMPAVASVGGLAAAGVVYVVSLRGGSSTSDRFLITGILVGGVLTAVTSLGLLFLGERVIRVIAWETGSLSSTTWKDVGLMVPYMVPGVLLLILAIPRANLLQLGDEIAVALGQRRERDRALVVLSAVVVTAGVVSVVGALGFVGLLGPHVARRLVGSDLRRLLPASVLVGAMLVLVADLLSRQLFATGAAGNLPVGVYLSVLGVPYVMVLLHRRGAA